MSNLIYLSKPAPSPQAVLDSVQSGVEEYDNIYVIAFPKDKRQMPAVWASGSLTEITVAQLLLQDLALAHINQIVETE